MNKKNKLVLVESEMKNPKGHFLNNLIESTFFFKKKFTIHWLLNKYFDNEGTYLPKIKIHKKIYSNIFKRKSNKLSYFIEEIILFFLNIFHIFYFSFFFFKQKKLLLYFNALKSNFYLLPRYFKSFYQVYRNLKLTKNDHIFFQTARRKDMSLINFLIKIDKNHPKFHIRVMLPPKEKFKGFFYFLKTIDQELRNKRAFIYLWSDFNYKTFLSKSLSKKGIYKSNIPWSFFNRKLKTKNHTIGYLGDARKARGFHLLPQIIEKLSKKNKSLKFLIQFSKIDNNLITIKNDLYKKSIKNKNIKIIEKYVDYKEFINILKDIDIMPILHNSREINRVTSGTMYSCIPYQIPMVVPVGTTFMKKILKHKSYEIAYNLNDFTNKISKISKNYSYYLNNVKINSKILRKILDDDPLKKNIS